MPIIMYRLVHTGAKSQLGGLKEGLLSVGYQVLTDWAVAQPPNAPTLNVKAIFIIKANGLNFMLRISILNKHEW